MITSSRSSASHPAPNSRRRRPCLVEPLEARIAPAAFTWTNLGSGNWTTSSNWSVIGSDADGIPDGDDDVTVNSVLAVTVTVDVGGQAAHSISVTGTNHLALTAGSLTIGTDSSIANLDVSAGTLISSGVLHLTGTSTLSGNPSLGGTIRVEGTLDLTSGEPDVTGSLIVAGTMHHGNALLDFNGGGGKLQIVSGGLYDTTNTQDDWGFRQFNGGLGVSVETGGTFRHSVASRFLTNTGNNPNFDVNGGTLDVTAGTLGINTGGTFTNAALTVAANSALSFLNTSSITVKGTLSGTGAGSVNLQDNGYLGIDAAGATFNFPGAMFQWSGQGTIGGPGVVTNTGTLNIGGGGDPNLRTELVSSGVINHGNSLLDFDVAAGKLRVVGGGIYNTVNTVDDYGFRQFNGGQGVFVESGGTFRHNSPNGSRFQFNTGNGPGFSVTDATIDVVHGTLSINTGGAFTNTALTIAASSALNFVNGSNITVKGTLTGTGAGTVNLQDNGYFGIDAAGASFNFPGAMFQWSGQGTIGGPGVVTNTGTLNMGGGGEPNLRTELVSSGVINHGNSLLDFDVATGKLRVVSGGIYNTLNTVDDYGFRQFNGGQGVFVESGGTFRHNSSNGSRFLFNTGNGPGFFVTDATIDVVHGTLTINTGGAFTNAALTIAASSALNFVNGSNITVKGTLTGTGAGTVNLQDNGFLGIDAAGATFNFPSAMFQWSGEGTIAGPGVVTNLGTLNIDGGGSPNLRTELVSSGVINHGNSYLDFDVAAGKLRVVNGGVYNTINTVSDWGFRQFNGGQGIAVESGGLFRHNSSTGQRFFLNTGNGPGFTVDHGTVDVVKGTLGINTGGAFTDTSLSVAANAVLAFYNGSNITVKGTLTGTGAGTVSLQDNGVLSIDPAGATFNFPGPMFQWSGEGVIAGPGTSVLTNTGTLNIDGGGSPNLRIELRNQGVINHGNSYLDFDVSTGKLRVLAGGVYNTINTAGDWGFRQFGGGLGLSVESGGTFRHNSSNGSRFFLNTGNAPDFSVAGGTIDVVKGTLGVNTGGTFTTAALSVAANAAIVFYGGSNITINGSFTGAGAGQVSLQDSGVLTIGAQGATFDFPGAMFQWSGEGAIGGSGVLSNLSTLNIAGGGSPNLRTELQNFGVINHGDSYLDFDVSTGKLRVLDGGLYQTINTGSDWGFRQFNGGQGISVETGGTYRHNSPTGARFLTDTGNDPLFSNTGTVDVVKGTLLFNGSVAQRSGGALTGGAWIVRDGAVLDLGANLTSNAGAITIEGTGSFPGLGGLGNNSGALILRGGADVTTTANFTNSGMLHLSTGSVLTTAAFTQTSTGKIEFEINGPTSADYGRVVASGAATLAGTARVIFNSDLSLGAGQALTLMSYTSLSGDFARFDGLSLQRTPVFEKVVSDTGVTLNSLVDAANLGVTMVAVDATGLAGQNIHFSYEVKNVSAFPTLATGWTDTIYLSKDDTLSADDVVFTRVAHSGVLAAGASYTSNVNTPLPGVVPGDYKLLVLADSRGNVPDPDRANNLGASASAATLDMPQLTPGVAATGTVQAGQDLWYRVTLPQGATPAFVFTGAVAGEAELYTSFGQVPTRADYDEGVFRPGSATQRVVGEASVAGTYYVLLHGRESAGGGQSFTLSASGLSFDLLGTELNHGSNLGAVTTTLTGAQFTPSTSFTLVPASGAQRTAQAVYFHDGNTVDATFDLTGLAAGTYSIRADNGAQTDTLPGAFTVIAGGRPGTLSFDFSSPRYVRPPFSHAVATLTYENIGDTDLAAPLFELLALNTRVRLADGTVVEGKMVQNGQVLTGLELLGVSGGAAGILSPGEKGSIDLSFEPISPGAHVHMVFDVFVEPPSNDLLQFDALKDDLRPTAISPEAWNQVYANLKAGVGPTNATYQKMLVENANYLGQFGPVSPEALRLLEFEVAQADDFGAISNRYALGELGRGNFAPFADRLTLDGGGNAIITDGQHERFFGKAGGATFLSEGVEFGQLTKAGDGSFTLQEIDGRTTVFRASDGRIVFSKDANGHQSTPAWNGSGQLLSVTDSVTGDVTTFTHNAQGRISSTTDAVGRTTTYGYDVSGEHLTSVTSPLGTSTFTYTPTGHALASATGPDGVTTSFTYDARGRLATESIGTGFAGLTRTLTYDNIAGRTLTDSIGHTSQIFRWVDGDVARTVDALGRVATAHYDSAGRFLGATDASGLSAKFSFDSEGLLSGLRSSDRSQVSFDLGTDAIRRVHSFTDQGGDTSTFDYDLKGNLLASTLPDGSATHFEYDAAGRVTASTDANGDRTVYTYDAHGLVTRRDLADGSHADFTYDAHRNLLTATDPAGATTFTYDAADRITSVAYPNGKSVAITYNAAGQRTTVSDQTGYTVRYAYDALGRLDTVRDTNNALLVDYNYDALGQLASETRGNGTSTSYAFDAQGRLNSITHKDASNAVAAQFAYTYDANDRIATMTTAAGTTDYAYDLAGQLKRVTLPGGQTIDYSYDAEGNRTAVADSAAGTENYTTNSGDQYTAAGGATLAYDGAGRLLTRTEGGVTTSYTYDHAGRLIGIAQPGSVVAFKYDALGNRIAKTENGVRTDFAYDPAGLGSVFGEYGTGGATHYATGLGLAARADAGGTEFYHFDTIGNTALVTDGTGAAVATYQYSAFGEITAHTGTLAQPFTFNGRVGAQDDPGDLFFMRARSYDAQLGRFTTRDPLAFTAGDANLYRFVGNDPVNRNDPSGRRDYYGGVGGELTVGGGFNAQAGLFVSDSDPLDFGPFVTGGVGVGLNAGVSGSAGSADDISGVFNNVNLSAGPVTGTNHLDDNGNVIGGSLGGGVGLPGGASFTVTYTQKLSPRAALDALGWVNQNRHSPQTALGRDLEHYLQQQSRNPLLALGIKRGLDNGLDPQEALLEAQRDLRRLRNELERQRYPHPDDHDDSEEIDPGDPNNIIGPAGAGADPLPVDFGPGQVRFDGFVNGTTPFGYRIDFENKPTASAPAQVVKVMQTLDADLDFSTFHFGSFGWGDFKVEVPADANGTSFHTTVDATATLGVKVQVDAELNTLNGQLLVTFTSLDPQTNDVPADPLAGFLPPNTTSPQGDAFLTYSVQPKTGLANGTRFDALATIVFDTEAPLDTPSVHNTLDNAAPTSQVTPFANATSSRPDFAVHWTASDEVGGSGLRGTTIFFTDTFNSVEGSLQSLTVTDPGSGMRFTGGQVGHTYKFFSVGTDAAGNVEALAGAPDAQVTVIAPVLITATTKTAILTDSDGDIYTVKLTGAGTLKYSTIDPDGAGPLNGPLDFLVVENGAATSALSVTVKRKADGPDADKLPDGDGIVTIGDVQITGALGSFTAKSSDLVLGGFTATGVVKTIAIRDLLQPDALAADLLIKTGGAATDKLALTARNLAGAFTINTPEQISALNTASISHGDVFAAALGSVSASAGAIDADLSITGKIGAITAKTSASGTWSGQSFGIITTKAGALHADITTSGAIAKIMVTGGAYDGDFTAGGAVGGITVKGGGISGAHTALSFGAISATGGSIAGTLNATGTPAVLKTVPGFASLSVSGGALSADLTSAAGVGAVTVTGGALSGDLTATKFGAIKVTGGNLSGTVISTATTADLKTALGIASVAVTTGSLTGDLTATGGIGGITIKGGGLSGHLAAFSFGALSITGGDFSGALTSLTAPATLKTKLALASLSVTGGDFTGDVRLLGGLGAVTLKFDTKTAKGGSIVGTVLDNATIVASKIGAISLTNNLTSALILAGADLGSDFALNGAGSAADTFAGGVIASLKVGGSVTGSAVGAGLNPIDGTIGNGNDGIAGGVTSTFGAITVTGNVDVATRFAGKFTGAIRIHGALVQPAPPQFIVPV
jgi:RHS repeat-associated protein